MANIRQANRKAKGSKKPTTKEARKRDFVYRPLEKEDKEYEQSPAYEAFMSVKWDDAWKEFLAVREDGVYVHKTSWALAKHLADSDKVKRKSIYEAIGPKTEESKKHRSETGVPYLGDWDHLRSSLFVGETKKQSLLFGNPRVQAIRDVVKTHLDVMKISQSIADIILEWLGRYQTWAQQIDEHFNYKLLDPKLSEEENDRRFKKYTEMQQYMLKQTLNCSRQILRCYGVGSDDVALLTQMVIAASKAQLGESTAKFMMAAASGIKVIDGGQARELPESTEENSDDPDAKEIKDVNQAFTGPKANPALTLMLGTFLQKAQTFRMKHPDIEIEGALPEDESLEPSAVDKDKANGKVNGKSKQVM